MGAAGAAAPWACTMDRLTPLAADPSLSSPPSFSYYTIYTYNLPKHLKVSRVFGETG